MEQSLDALLIKLKCQRIAIFKIIAPCQPKAYEEDPSLMPFTNTLLSEMCLCSASLFRIRVQRPIVSCRKMGSHNQSYPATEVHELKYLTSPYTLYEYI